MQVKHLLTLSSFILVVGLLLLSCTTPAATPTPTPTPTPAPKTAPTEQPQYGGILKFIRNAGPTRIGWAPLVIGEDYFAASPALEHLFLSDNKGQATPMLATDWKWDPNGNFVILNLRKGVRFHDGTDWNANAAKYDLDLHMKERPADLTGVTSIDVIDEYTIRLNTKSYNAYLIYVLTSLDMASPTALAKGKDAVLYYPVGTGPFKFVDFKRDAYLKYQRFDDYWGGKPYLDGVEMYFVPDPMTASASFQAGEAQMLEQIPYKETRDLISKGYPYLSSNGTMSGLAPDSANAKSVYADKRVRQALDYAIDRKAIMNALGFGFSVARDQMYTPGSTGYISGLSRPYDPAKAKELLAAAGYPNGFKTTIICDTQRANRDIMVAVQDYLLKVGIDAKLDFADPARWGEYRRVSGWKDALIYMNNAVMPNPGKNILSMLSKEYGDYPSMLRPAEMEDLFKKLVITVDPQPN